jgi:hypothetical protein
MKLLALIILISQALAAQRPGLVADRWGAHWISVPGAPPAGYGVYHFRRVFDLASRPASFKIHVTADQRYQLFVNGERAGFGPARGDLYHWRFETYDIAKLLRPGRNLLAAVVWHAGPDAPMAQVTHETGLLVHGDSDAERAVDTGKNWRCIRNQAYAPEPVTRELLPWGYYVVGPGERVDAAKYPWGWELPDYDDSAWMAPAVGEYGAGREARDSHSRWMLVPRSIPMMEETPERLSRLRRAEGVAAPAAFPSKPAAVQVPAHTKAVLLVDQDHLTTAFPELVVSGGRGAVVTIGYAEALFSGPNQKGNRNEIEGKQFYGNQDVFLADGGAKRLFRPLWWRTYRYVRIAVETKDEPLTIDDLRGTYTGYPFVRKAKFDADSEELRKFLDVGWRTARLCAHESYMDCPYYEQLQYAGDTRIQALVSLYMTGDARLMRNAIEQLDSSRTSEGATFSRAPSRLPQYIPPFSLWWIGMVHDYWMYAGDPLFVREMAPGVRAVLAFYAKHQKADGSLGRLPWWNFVDWAREWKDGVPPAGLQGGSAPLDLQLLLACRWAAEMEAAIGSKALAGEYRAKAQQLAATIRSLYWNSGRRMFADTADGANFSQHSQALAVLAGVVAGEEARDLVNRTVDDRSIVQCTIYFRHYLHSALNKAGAGDRYLDLLGEWRTMLDRGLTTWAEHADPVRSDCHAWGASPNYELFRTVLGIDSAAPQFRRVVIRPYLGKLARAAGSIPHPSGTLSVRLERVAGGLRAEIGLPPGVEGEFVWNGQTRPLGPGATKLSVP